MRFKAFVLVGAASFVLIWPQAAAAEGLRCSVPGGWRDAPWGRVWMPGLYMDLRPESFSSPDWRQWSVTGTDQEKTFYGPTATARVTPQLIELSSAPAKQDYEAGTAPDYRIYRLSIDRQTLAAEVSEDIEPGKGTFTWHGACVVLQ